VPFDFVLAKNRNVTLAPVIVPKNANDSLVNCKFKRPLNRIENTDNTRIIDAVICAIFVDITFKIKDFFLSLCVLNSRLYPKIPKKYNF